LGTRNALMVRRTIMAEMSGREDVGWRHRWFGIVYEKTIEVIAGENDGGMRRRGGAERLTYECQSEWLKEKDEV
jgi:hypothetical protein